MNFSRFFDVSSSKSHIFSQKFSFFLTDLTKKFEKKFQKFFHARDLRPVPNDGKFCALSRGKISAQSNTYFFCYLQNKFSFLLSKITISFLGYGQKLIYTPYDPQIWSKTAPNRIRKSHEILRLYLN